METQLYIPKKIKVGYQKREDNTYSKRLAYIIYFDDKGKLRKETSWQGWRDHKQPVEDYDNEPTEGFVLHKDIKRYNWSHFSSHRTMIRVYDPRGVEFEITTENLIGILMNSDCSKRALSGKYVYAWAGPELVLLPTTCEEYDQAANFTVLQAAKIGVKDLVAGCSYKTKKEDDLVYVGKYMWYDFGNWYRSDKANTRAGKKHYIFTSDDGKTFLLKSGLEFLAVKNSDTIVSNFAEIIEKFQKNPHSSDIVKWEVVPCEVNLETGTRPYYGSPMLTDDGVYFQMHGDTIIQYQLHARFKYNNNPNVEVEKYTLEGFTVSEQYKLNSTNNSQIKEMKSGRDGYSSYYYNRPAEPKYSAEEIQKQGYGYLFVTLENGKRIKVKSLYEL
jgi:hypothetical protein